MYPDSSTELHSLPGTFSKNMQGVLEKTPAPDVLVKPSTHENTKKTKALANAKSLTMGRQGSISLKNNIKNQNTNADTVATLTTPGVTTKTPFRRDYLQGAPDQITRISTELKGLRKEFNALNKLFHAHVSKSSQSMDKKSGSVNKECAPIPPVSWYCTYSSGQNNEAPFFRKSLDGTAGLPTTDECKLHVLNVEQMLQKTQLCDKSVIPGFVALHRSDLSIQDQLARNTENILYAGLLHFTIPNEARAGIALAIKDKVSPTQLCNEHPEFLKARNTAKLLCNTLEARNLSPTCWCTGEDGFCVVWQDASCFLRFKKHKVVEWSRCVDFFMQTYLDESTFQAIDGKFEHWNGVFDTQYASSYTYHCPVSPSVTPTPANSDTSAAQMPIITQTKLVSTKLASFWHFLLCEKPPIMKTVTRLPLAAAPLAAVAVNTVDMTIDAPPRAIAEAIATTL